MDAYTPYPIEALTEALDIHDHTLPAVVLGGGILGGDRAVRALLLDVGHRRTRSTSAASRSTACRRSSSRPSRRRSCSPRCPRFSACWRERPADAVSPGLQHAALCPRLARPVLPLHRGEGPPVRPRRHVGFLTSARAEGRDGRGRVMTRESRRYGLTGLLRRSSRSRCSPLPAARTCRTSRSTRTFAARPSSTTSRSARPLPRARWRAGSLYADQLLTGQGRTASHREAARAARRASCSTAAASATTSTARRATA